MRILVVLAVAATCVSAQSPLIKILTGELDRNFATLKDKGNPAPYFIGYSVTDRESDTLSASDGAISRQNHSRARLLDVTVRVGSPKFDNYRRVNGQIPNFTSTTTIALEDDPLAIRQAVWLATDQVYRSASQRLIQIQADEKLRAAATDGSDDFSAETPQVFFEQPPVLKFSAAEWVARLRRLSADFAKYPGALNSSITLQTERTMETLVTTEGTRLGQGRLFSRIVITTAGKALDGMDLQTLETFEADDPAHLPQGHRDPRSRGKSRQKLAGPFGCSSVRSICRSRNLVGPCRGGVFPRDFRPSDRRTPSEGRGRRTDLHQERE